MIPVNDAPHPPSTTKVLRWVASAGVSTALALALAACATPTGGASASPSMTSSPTASATPTPVDSPTPEPSSSPDETAAPFNGEVLLITAEVLDGQLQVTAMVPKVSEDDGTCTLEVVGTDRAVSVTSTAGNDVTYCGVMSVPADAAAADLQFRVRYESPSTRAESAVSTVAPAS